MTAFEGGKYVFVGYSCQNVLLSSFVTSDNFGLVIRAQGASLSKNMLTSHGYKVKIQIKLNVFLIEAIIMS